MSSDSPRARRVEQARQTFTRALVTRPVADCVEVRKFPRGPRRLQSPLNLAQLVGVKIDRAVAPEERVPDSVRVARAVEFEHVRIPVSQVRVVPEPDARESLVPVYEDEAAFGVEQRVLRRAVAVYERGREPRLVTTKHGLDFALEARAQSLRQRRAVVNLPKVVESLAVEKPADEIVTRPSAVAEVSVARDAYRVDASEQRARKLAEGFGRQTPFAHGAFAVLTVDELADGEAVREARPVARVMNHARVRRAAARQLRFDPRELARLRPARVAEDFDDVRAAARLYAEDFVDVAEGEATDRADLRDENRRGRLRDGLFGRTDFRRFQHHAASSSSGGNLCCLRPGGPSNAMEVL